MRGIDKVFLGIAVFIMLSAAAYAEEKAVPLSGSALYTYGNPECVGAQCKVGDAYYGCKEPCFCYDLDGNREGTCEECCGPRTIGYWGGGNNDLGGEVCNYYLRQEVPQNPWMKADYYKMQDYLNYIKAYSNVFSGLQSVADLCAVLDIGGAKHSSMLDKARQQLMGLWLNVVSVKLCPDREISLRITSSTTVRQAIAEIEYVIINGPSTDLERVKNIADYINNGIGLSCVSAMPKEECTSGDFGCNQVDVSATKSTVTSTNQVTQSPINNLVVNFYSTEEGGCAYNKEISYVYNSCPVLSSCITDAKGQCIVQLITGQYLAVAKSGAVYLSTVFSNNNIDVYDSSLTVLSNNAELFLIEYSDSGSTSQIPGKKIKLKGSELDIIEPDYLNWQDSIQACPFVLSTNDTWLVNISLKVPDDVLAIGGSSQSELVVKETTAMLFRLSEMPRLTGSAVQSGQKFGVVINAKSYVGDAAEQVRQIMGDVLKTAEQGVQVPQPVVKNQLEVVKSRVFEEVQPSSTQNVSEQIENLPGSSLPKTPSIYIVLLLLVGLVLVSYLMKRK